MMIYNTSFPKKTLKRLLKGIYATGDPKDIFTFVNILYLRGEYRRAVYFIQTNRLQISFYGAYLIAKVFYV